MCNTNDITDYMSESEALLDNALIAYDNGNMELFKDYAASLYNEYCSYPSPLEHNNPHPYLLGTVYSRMAQFYAYNINAFASIIENALYCFSKTIIESDDVVEKQCAAQRMVLLLDDNWWFMQQVAKNFIKFSGNKLYRDYSELTFSILSGGMTPNAYEDDILGQLGYYCVKVAQSNSVHSFISVEETARYKSCINDKRFQYHPWALTNVKDEKLFELFYEFLSLIVQSMVKRRVMRL